MEKTVFEKTINEVSNASREIPSLQILAYSCYAKLTFQINRICEKVYIKKRTEENGDQDKKLKLFMNIAIAIVFLAFIVSLASVFDKDINNSYFIISVIMVSVSNTSIQNFIRWLAILS